MAEKSAYYRVKEVRRVHGKRRKVLVLERTEKPIEPVKTWRP
jgi:hypothetical protein